MMISKYIETIGRRHVDNILCFAAHFTEHSQHCYLVLTSENIHVVYSSQLDLLLLTF